MGAGQRQARRGHLSLGELKVMSAKEQCRSAALAGSGAVNDPLRFKAVLRWCVPACVCPQFATHRRIREHEAYRIGNFLGANQPA